MVFAWDEKKNRINHRKHGISFETAARIFEDPNVVSYRDRVVDEEERWHAIGCAGGIAILFVVHTSEEEYGEEEIRIISARKASPRERALFAGLWVTCQHETHRKARAAAVTVLSPDCGRAGPGFGLLKQSTAASRVT
jgi:uncharacterized DUF497 family protein